MFDKVDFSSNFSLLFFCLDVGLKLFFWVKFSISFSLLFFRPLFHSSVSFPQMHVQPETLIGNIHPKVSCLARKFHQLKITFSPNVMVQRARASITFTSTSVACVTKISNELSVSLCLSSLIYFRAGVKYRISLQNLFFIANFFVKYKRISCKKIDSNCGGLKISKHINILRFWCM